MTTRDASMEEMLSRTARFKELTPSEQAFVDSRIPGCERDVFTVIGGTDAGRVDWPDDVLERARATGLNLDADGNLLGKS